MNLNLTEGPHHNIRQQGFDVARCSWSLFNRFRTGQKKKKKVSHGQQGQLRESSSPYGALSQRGLLDPIKLAYDHTSAGWPAQIDSQRL